jgi:sterol desaturase/sphingolipid hydroxylase (fatty acid hydroxylase superfamily)
MLDHLIYQTPEILFVIGFLALLIWEIKSPNREYGFNRAWYRRLAILLGLSVALTQIVTPLLDRLIGEHVLSQTAQQFCAQQSAIVSGCIVYLSYTFINYWWHRARHHSDFLWRAFHQIHHSTHQLNTFTAFYAHPLDYLSTMLIINVLSAWVFGLDVTATAWATVISGFFEVWEHTNIRTPKWLGFIIVRPEMHRVHHEIHQHQRNYSIPLWDMLFGTYENSGRDVDCGFDHDLENHLQSMLLFEDAHRAK